MRNIPAVKIIFFISLFVAATCLAHAESYNEDMCFKDYVKSGDQDVVLAINRDTQDVELYWSDKDQTWIKPEKDYQKKLQKLYDKKIQLQQMQSRLNKMNYDTMYTTSQGSGGHR